MSEDVVLYKLLKKTFALLLGNVDVGKNCEFLVQKLDARIQEIRRYGISNELFTSLSNLKGAFVSLRACLASLDNNTVGARLAEDDFKEAQEQARASSEVSKPNYPNKDTEHREKAKQTNDFEDNDRLLSCPKDATLQKELREIKESDKFKQAMEYFRQSNTLSEKAFAKENKGEIKITATKVRVISEILGNLTDLGTAADKCKKYISELHDDYATLNLHRFSFSNLKNAVQVYLLDSPEKEGINSIIHINVVVFRIMKGFTRQPPVMLDWPMIHGQEPQKFLEKFHPILGELPEEIDPPDPFTQLTDVSKKVQINSCTAAINCNGDIFAKKKASTDIVRITPNCTKWYSFNNEVERNIDIVSIAIDCAHCKTFTKSELGETSTQSNVASPCMSTIVCHGKMYILARNKSKSDFHYYLYVVDMEGKTKRSYTLGYLLRSSTENVKLMIFCIEGQKLVIVEATRQVWVRICDTEGVVKEKINLTAQLRNTYIYTISYNGEIVCLNDESVLNVYKLNEERCSEKLLSKTCEVKRTVKAIAYNHELEKFIILCYATLSNQYHLVTYAKADGQLKEDIKLNNDNNKYRKAKLICHPSGPVVLLDNHKLLYLKR